MNIHLPVCFVVFETESSCVDKAGLRGCELGLQSCTALPGFGASQVVLTLRQDLTHHVAWASLRPSCLPAYSASQVFIL